MTKKEMLANNENSHFFLVNLKTHLKIPQKITEFPINIRIFPKLGKFPPIWQIIYTFQCLYVAYAVPNCAYCSSEFLCLDLVTTNTFCEVKEYK